MQLAALSEELALARQNVPSLAHANGTSRDEGGAHVLQKQLAAKQGDLERLRARNKDLSASLKVSMKLTLNAVISSGVYRGGAARQGVVGVALANGERGVVCRLAVHVHVQVGVWLRMHVSAWSAASLTCPHKQKFCWYICTS